MIRILIAEDQRLLAEALKSLLNLEADLQVTALAADGEAAWQHLSSAEFDIVLSDIEMPKLSGLELAQRLHDAGRKERVVMVTAFARTGFLRRALDAGVKAYLLKDTPSEKLAEVIRLVHRGGRYVPAELADQLWAQACPLSERERQVLQLAGMGRSSEDIGTALHLSSGTVRNYLSEAISKLGAVNRIEAYRMAREQGWL